MSDNGTTATVPPIPAQDDPAIVPPVPGRIHGDLKPKVVDVVKARPIGAIVFFGAVGLISVAIVGGFLAQRDRPPAPAQTVGGVAPAYLATPEASPQLPMPDNGHVGPAPSVKPSYPSVVIPQVNMPAGTTSQSESAAQSAADQYAEQQRLAQAQVVAATRTSSMTIDAAPNTSGAAQIGGVRAQYPGADAAGAGTDTTQQGQVRQPASPFTLMAGTLLPVSLTSGIDSSIPGKIVAQVRQNVYDSATGHLLLVPIGTKLVGDYAPAASSEQGRVVVSLQRLMFPNGQSCMLKDMLAVDPQGYSGLPAKVDNHRGKAIGNVILLSLLGVGAQLSQPQISSGGFYPPAATAGQVAAGQLGQNLSNLAISQTQKSVDLPPTLHVKPGASFNVLLDRDIVLPGVYQADNSTTGST